MGNCLKSHNSDDISLLRGNDAADHSHGPEPPQPVGPPPPYQVKLLFYFVPLTSLVLDDTRLTL